jgi:hypothetical protein
MASERQISANRRNAQKSAGPRTEAGKRRASRNAHWHGLASQSVLSVDFRQQIEELTRTLSGDSDSALTREWARTAAESTLDLARVQHVKLALLNRITAAQDQQNSSSRRLKSQGSEQSEENILLVLSELQALERYEQRFSSRRNRAIRKIVMK